MIDIVKIPRPAVKISESSGKRRGHSKVVKHRKPAVPSEAQEIPRAFAWGSNRAATVDGKELNQAFTSHSNSNALLSDEPSIDRPTSEVLAIRRVSDGPEDDQTRQRIHPWALPDAVLFKIHSNQPLMTVDLSIWQDHIDDRCLEDVRHRNSTFSKLVIRRIRGGGSCLQNLIARHLGHLLLEIDVSNSAVVDSSWLATIARECPKITRITACRCPKVTDSGVSAIGRRKGPKLQALGLAGCENVTDDGIEILAKNCRYLRSLDLGGCPKVRDRSVYAISALTHLEELSLDDCHEVSNEAVQRLLTSVTKLVSLSLKRCGGITEEGLRYMHDMPVVWGERRHYGCAHLEAFHVARNDSISDQFILVLATLCPQLRTLDIRECPSLGGDEAMGKIGRLAELSCLKLETLNRVSDQGFRNFFLGGLPKKSLKSLSLIGCPKVTDVSLRCIAKSARNLRQLNLHRNVSVTDGGLGYLATGLRHVSVLQATELGMVSNEGVQLIARKCTRLRYLDISHCPRLTWEVLPALRRLRRLESLGLSGCRGMLPAGHAGCTGDLNDNQGERMPVLMGAEFRSLRHLDIANHADLSDEGVKTIAKRNGKTLSSLNVSKCPLVTIGGLLGVVRSLQSLTRLDATGCEGLTESDLEALAKSAAPHLLLARARVEVDGFDGIHCCGSASDTRAQMDMVKAARAEDAAARALQRAIRRYRADGKQRREASRRHRELALAAVVIQVECDVYVANRIGVGAPARDLVVEADVFSVLSYTYKLSRLLCFNSLHHDGHRLGSASSIPPKRTTLSTNIELY